MSWSGRPWNARSSLSGARRTSTSGDRVSEMWAIRPNLTTAPRVQWRRRARPAFQEIRGGERQTGEANVEDVPSGSRPAESPHLVALLSGQIEQGVGETGSILKILLPVSPPPCEYSETSRGYPGFRQDGAQRAQLPATQHDGAGQPTGAGVTALCPRRARRRGRRSSAPRARSRSAWRRRSSRWSASCIRR